MFGRKTEGSVICTSCGVLVGVNDPTCYNCGRRNPGMWGFAPALRRLGNDLGFIPFVTGFTIIMYVLSLVAGDRPGLLARIALILDRHNIRLHRAKINTLGSRAEDVFWVSGAMLSNPEETRSLLSELLEKI